jgi:hypothetical protein
MNGGTDHLASAAALAFIAWSGPPITGLPAPAVPAGALHDVQNWASSASCVPQLAQKFGILILENIPLVPILRYGP